MPVGPSLSYVGGPTALIEWSGARLLTDPTLDPAGTEYATPAYTLRKTMGPALGADALLPLDAVLLSHDHHFDNLDHAGRRLLSQAGRVFTTTEGAARIGREPGLAPWQTASLDTSSGTPLRVTATPARHGPSHADRGPVIGFVVEGPGGAIYLSGDTVWYEGVAEVAARFRVRSAVLFMGAARVAAAGDWPLTFTGEDAVSAARAFAGAAIVPLHFEGWAHFSESRAQIERAFATAGLADRLRWPPPGIPIRI
ncbi:MAG TPA: MBL fold metallo-hydrolase [Gemmatimonadales bacterium]|nr:MBL fold metallo-hydrolase [Gemmatimonadales bacterium]